MVRTSQKTRLQSTQHKLLRGVVAVSSHRLKLLSGIVVAGLVLSGALFFGQSQPEVRASGTATVNIDIVNLEQGQQVQFQVQGNDFGSCGSYDQVFSNNGQQNFSCSGSDFGAGNPVTISLYSLPPGYTLQYWYNGYNDTDGTTSCTTASCTLSFSNGTANINLQVAGGQNDPPTAPYLSVGGVTTSSIGLSWTASHATDQYNTPAFYNIYRIINGSAVYQTGTNSSQLSYTVSGLSCGTNYSYEVQATGGTANQVSTSNVVTTNTSACPSSAPPPAKSSGSGSSSSSTSGSSSKSTSGSTSQSSSASSTNKAASGSASSSSSANPNCPTYQSFQLCPAGTSSASTSGSSGSSSSGSGVESSGGVQPLNPSKLPGIKAQSATNSSKTTGSGGGRWLLVVFVLIVPLVSLGAFIVYRRRQSAAIDPNVYSELTPQEVGAVMPAASVYSPGTQPTVANPPPAAYEPEPTADPLVQTINRAFYPQQQAPAPHLQKGDDVPDMFQLAHDHPGSYGSESELEAYGQAAAASPAAASTSPDTPTQPAATPPEQSPSRISSDVPAESLLMVPHEPTQKPPTPTPTPTVQPAATPKPKASKKAEPVDKTVLRISHNPT